MAKKKPCDFCEGDFFGDPDVLKNAEIYFERYPDNGAMGFTVISFSDDHEMNGEERYSIPFEYCPQCGRKLC